MLDQETTELHNSLLQGASDLLMPYLFLDDRKEKEVTTPDDRAAVQRGIEMLERVLQINPQNWSASWFLGMASNVLGRLDDAYKAFARAHPVRLDRSMTAQPLLAHLRRGSLCDSRQAP
jgi:cytochrome c-type biogenesis protein CcmH/NrfG